MADMWLAPDILDRTAKTPGHYRKRNRMSVQIDTVVLHQTSFNRGSVPDNYLTVHAHFVVLPDGTIVQLHPIETYLVASSAFNDDAISVEIVGNFPDERGVYWEPQANGRSVLSPQQISGACDLVRYLRNTYVISFVFAHRQGELENLRGNCPGPDIWYNVGQWAVDNLGMDDGGKGYKELNGSPIPDSWRRPRA
jgi:N-acetyl-anhydromuramyl-L-alanine amidase AmpD